MHNSIPATPPWKKVSTIVNLDDESGSGTHCVCYKNRRSHVLYFDGYGNLRPPVLLVKYFGNTNDVRYDYERKQPANSVIFIVTESGNVNMSSMTVTVTDTDPANLDTISPSPWNCTVNSTLD